MNPSVGATAADVPVHRVIDLGIGRLGTLREQGGGLHDLAALAIPALGNVVLLPGELAGMGAVGVQPLDRGDLFAGYGLEWRDTTANRFPVLVHGAGAAKSHAATKFCAGQVQLVAQ